MDEEKLQQQISNAVAKAKSGQGKAIMLCVAAFVVFVLIACVAGYYAWQHHTAQQATIMSQQEAITASGVEAAAKNAHIKLQQSQLDEVAQKIAALANKPPERIVQTIPVQVPVVIEKERQAAGADFAIVTDKDNKDKKWTADELKKLPPDTTVNLNQYNVHAYKKVLRQVDIVPDWAGTIQGRPRLQEVSYSVSRKITDDGKYVGYVAGYDLDNHKAKIGLRLTF